MSDFWIQLALGIAFFYLGTKVPDHRQNDRNELRKDDNK